MDENNILFKVKDLEKTIIRNLEPTLEEKKKICNMMNKPTPTQMQIIGYVLKNIDRDVFQKDLEQALNLRRATISDVLQRMENNGLIRREQSENDARSKKIILSDDAKEIFKSGSSKISELEKIAIKDISEFELKIFSDVINKMIENINRR